MTGISLGEMVVWLVIATAIIAVGVAVVLIGFRGNSRDR
jgi:hypothetical protein